MPSGAQEQLDAEKALEKALGGGGDSADGKDESTAPDRPSPGGP